MIELGTLSRSKHAAGLQIGRAPGRRLEADRLPAGPVRRLDVGLEVVDEERLGRVDAEALDRECRVPFKPSLSIFHVVTDLVTTRHVFRGLRRRVR